MNPTCRLVVNGDDGGLAEATDQALLRAAHEGILTSVSLVANGAHTEAFVARARQAHLGLGLHLNLTEGRALCDQVPSLTDPAGHLRGKQWVLTQGGWRTFKLPDLLREIRAQWQHLQALGAELDHVDGHNHVHLLPPVHAALARALGETGRLFLRVPEEPECPRELRPDWPDERLRRADLAPRQAPFRLAERFAGLLFSHQADAGGLTHLDPPRPGLTELMVHPGRRPGSGFTEDPARRAETDCLCQPATRAWLEARGYELCRFKDVP